MYRVARFPLTGNDEREREREREWRVHTSEGVSSESSAKSQ